MPPSEPPAFETLLGRRDESGRSLVVQIAAAPASTTAEDGLAAIERSLESDRPTTERIALARTGRAHQFLETAGPGALLVLERRDSDVADGTWGQLVTLFANARYRGVHAVLVTPDVPTLVERGLNVRIEPRGEVLGAALLEPSDDDPERTTEIDLGTVE